MISQQPVFPKGLEVCFLVLSRESSLTHETGSLNTLGYSEACDDEFSFQS
jgi:hypothetical protein